MPSVSERRKFWRTAFHAPAALASEGQRISVDIIDLSLKGALIEAPDGWHPGRGQSAELALPLSADACITMQMRVAHVESQRVGLKCEHIDLDSMTHLRKLVELNSGDPSMLERELAILSA